MTTYELALLNQCASSESNTYSNYIA